MTKMKLLAAAAVMSAMVASPVMAQDYVQPRASVHHQNYDSNASYRGDTSWAPRDTGFWPGDVAAGIVGGAVGTAGAIATAPFRANNSYAYNSYNSTSLSGPNGFVCQPGTWFRGADGRRHICQ